MTDKQLEALEQRFEVAHAAVEANNTLTNRMRFERISKEYHAALRAAFPG